MKTKTAIIIALALMCLGLIALRLALKRNPSPNPPMPQSTSKFSGPLPFSPAPANPTITAVKATKPLPPQKMWQYNTNNLASPSVMTDIASLLGFEGTPSAESVGDTTYYDWTAVDRKFTARDLPPNFYFTLFKTSSLNIPILENASNTAISHFGKLPFPKEKVAIAPLSHSFIYPNLLPGKEGSQAATGKLANLSLHYTLHTLPLYFDSNLDMINYQVDADNNIVSFNITPPPILLAEEEVQPPDPKESLNSLLLNRGVLVSAIPNVPTSDSEVDFSLGEVNITTARYVYIFLTERQIIIPGIEFIGNAPSTIHRTVHYTVTYLVSYN